MDLQAKTAEFDDMRYLFNNMTVGGGVKLENLWKKKKKKPKWG